MYLFRPQSTNIITVRSHMKVKFYCEIYTTILYQYNFIFITIAQYISIILRKSQFENASPQTLDFIGLSIHFFNLANRTFYTALNFCILNRAFSLSAISAQSLQYLLFPFVFFAKIPQSAHLIYFSPLYNRHS